MLSVKAKYKNGHIILQEEISFNESMDVIVTFLDKDISQSDKEQDFDPYRFSFYKAQEVLKDLKSDLSDEIINERRSYL